MKINELKEGMYIREVGKRYNPGAAILISKLNFTSNGTLSELHGTETIKDMSDRDVYHPVEYSGEKPYMQSTVGRFYEVPISELNIESI
tara:strand:- start:2229 stop:2495 length:267 start_codon:yes stop_codon:yes gene_type:complete